MAERYWGSLRRARCRASCRVIVRGAPEVAVALMSWVWSVATLCAKPDATTLKRTKMRIQHFWTMPIWNDLFSAATNLLGSVFTGFPRNEGGCWCDDESSHAPTRSPRQQA